MRRPYAGELEDNSVFFELRLLPRHHQHPTAVFSRVSWVSRSVQIEKPAVNFPLCHASHVTASAERQVTPGHPSRLEFEKVLATSRTPATFYDNYCQQEDHVRDSLIGHWCQHCRRDRPQVARTDTVYSRATS